VQFDDDLRENFGEFLPHSPDVHARICTQSAFLIRRVYAYFSQFFGRMRTHRAGSKPVLGEILGFLGKVEILDVTTKICGLPRRTISEHISPMEDFTLPNCQKPSNRVMKKDDWARAVKNTDSFIRDYIRRTIHQHYRSKTPVTIDGLLAEIKNDLKSEPDLSFSPSRSHFHKILRGMGFHYAKINRRPIIFERQDIVEWRRNFVRFRIFTNFGHGQILEKLDNIVKTITI
jgi:hypothetical protein